MRLLTYREMTGYSDTQLQAVVRCMRTVLPLLVPGSRKYEIALLNLRHAQMLLDRLRRQPAYRL